MAKQREKQQEVIGWFQPHIAVDWTGEVVDPKTGELVKEPSMTKQSFKDECDINNIVKKFEATQSWDHVQDKLKQGYYDDLPDGLDLQAGYNIIHQAETAFMALPANVRAEFNNDPVQFVEAFRNPSEAHIDKFVELGLADLVKPKTAPEAPGEPPKEPPKS